MSDSHVFQENDSYCGPAVAQMVLRRFGTDMTQAEIAQALETDMQVGTSAKELQKFFENRGFVVERYNGAEWVDIAHALGKGAVIVGYIEPGGDPHYSLVKSVREEAVVLTDPYHGDDFSLAKQEFLERWRDNEVGQYGPQVIITIAPPAK